MNTYEERQEARRQRYLDRAEKAEQDAAGRFKSADERSDLIPFGQPILVGHHSEKRHRRDLARIDRDMRAGIDASKKAEHYAGKAESVGKAGISSDDPEAIVKLREKIAKLETVQARMVAANKLVRKQDRAGLAASGYDESQIAGLFTPDFAGRLGFPNYALTNNNANIRRLKTRLAELARASSRETVEHEPVDGVQFVENAEINRVQLIFSGKPAAEIRQQLKRRGFRWSPSEGAWQRHLNNGGIYAAQDFVAWLERGKID